jgi:hypothetical protein
MSFYIVQNNYAQKFTDFFKGPLLHRISNSYKFANPLSSHGRNAANNGRISQGKESGMVSAGMQFVPFSAKKVCQMVQRLLWGKTDTIP